MAPSESDDLPYAKYCDGRKQGSDVSSGAFGFGRLPATALYERTGDDHVGVRSGIANLCQCAAAGQGSRTKAA
jgi:hypothetical protein